MIPSSRERYRRLYNFGGNFIYANSGPSSTEHHFVCDQMAINLVTKSLIIGIDFTWYGNLCANPQITFHRRT